MSESDFNKVFSANLNYYLQLRGHTQAELAKYVGVSTAAVNTWCKGLKNPRMDKTDKICTFLQVKRSDLMEDHSYRPAAPPQFSDGELEHMRKYRYLDEYGRSFVDDVLNREYDRCASERGNLSNLSDMLG